MVRRKTESVRAGRADQTDQRGSGLAVPWYDRAPPDEEFNQRRSQLEANGVDVHTSYWQAGDWFGVGVEPIGQFVTNAPDWGGEWHVTMGVIPHADPRRLRAFRVHWEYPKRLRLYFHRIQDNGVAYLRYDDPIRNDPYVQEMYQYDWYERPPHITM